TLAQYNLGLAQVWIPSTKSAGLLFDCADIPDGVSQSIMLDMTVTDESGNQDFCPVELILQDNANLCPDLITNGSVSGRIVSLNNKVPIGTSVTVNSVENNKSKVINTQGLYTVDSLPLGREYEIKPTLNINPLDGVTTTDLVLIQRHILGIATFDNPYKLIAADINSSKSVSAIDLVELRKLILGIKVSFPNNLPSWVFVPKDFAFTSNNSPYNYNSTIVIDNLASDVDSLDFIAVKIGDVNGTATGQAQTDEHIENRNKNIEIIVSNEVINDQEQLVLRAGSEHWTEGLQLFLTYPNAEQLLNNNNQDSQIFDDSEVFIKGDHVRMVAYSPYKRYLKEGDIIASFDIVHDKLDLKSLDKDANNLSAIFTDLIANNVSLVIRENEVVDKTSFRLMTNPVSSQLVLKYNTADSELLQYTVYNAEGKSLLSSNINLQPGMNQELSISLEDHLMPGIYFLKLAQGSYSETLKFIRIK
nr:T9SS type A sorting domain-containing protein [Saprospiraceae bacterium]